MGKERRNIKRYGQSFTKEDAEWLGAAFDIMARGGDVRNLRESATFKKLYSQIVRLRVRVREDAGVVEERV